MLCIPLELTTAPLSKEAVFEKITAACDCTPPPQGPPGATGASNFLGTFGSYYSLQQFEGNGPYPIEVVSSNVSVFNVPLYEAHIVETGIYYLHYGTTCFTEGATEVALFNNNVQINGTRMFIPGFPPGLASVAVIVPLTAGDVITINGFAALRIDVNDPVTVFLDLIKLSPL